jgi:membrane-associated protease RseP (regulator of RpoE activity)
MTRLLGLFLVIACAAGVAWYVMPPPAPRGFSGLEFATMTRAAAARAPLLTSRGALIYEVADDSPAAAAAIKPGAVVAAIDGQPVSSARQASDIVRGHHAGDHVTLTLFDEAEGDIHPRNVTLVFAAEAPVTRKLSVDPPRTLAKEFFYPPPMAANAAWSRRILRGPTIKPLALTGLGAGRCNGLAPDEWEVRGHAADDSMLHLAAKAGFMHALFETLPLKGRGPAAAIQTLLTQTFQAPVTMAASQPQPFGFTLFKFGLNRGAVGFVLYRAEKDHISAWIAAVPAADAAWAEPLAGAVALSLRCSTSRMRGPAPRDPVLPGTSISARCLAGSCDDGDFAGAYMSVLRLGYVHDAGGNTYLINPRRDFWQNGADGPGYYHQIGGTNEKLGPGRGN